MATPSVLAVPAVAPAGAQASPFAQVKQQYGIYSAGEVGRIVQNLPAEAHIVEGLLAHASVNILVGDSGVGKTAFGYQLALAVASGTPFLGFPVQKNKVLLVDYENGIWDFNWILEQQRRHLGLNEFPANFLVWPGRPDGPVVEVMERLHPHLVILDSLRSYQPGMEGDSKAAAARIRELRHLAREFGAAVLLMHHVHKRAGGPGDLENLSPLDWLLRTAGSRALINQTDVRLALAARKDGETLVLSGQARARGPIGPFVLRRVWDADGEPLGYERVSACGLLNNPEQEAAAARLPKSFHFVEAMRIYGRACESTSLFLRKLMNAGLLQKVGRGQYRKCEITG